MAAERMRDCREGMRLGACLVVVGAGRLDYVLKIWPALNCRRLQAHAHNLGPSQIKARPRQVLFESVTGNPSPPAFLATASEWLLALMRNVCRPAEREAVLVSLALL